MKKFLKISGILAVGLTVVYLLGNVFLDLMYKQTLQFMSAADANNIPAMEKMIAEGYNPQQTFFRKNLLNAYLNYKSVEEKRSSASADVVRFLLKQGISPNNEYKSNFSSLQFAIGIGNNEIVKILLGAGADVNYIGKGGYTPLDGALATENYDIAGLLVKQGAKLGIYKNKPLYQFVYFCVQQEDCLKIIKEAAIGHTTDKADPAGYVIQNIFEKELPYNVFSEGSASPLYVAVESGLLETAETLLKAGANPNSLNINGMSPLDLAIELNNYDMASLLIKYKADLSFFKNDTQYNFARFCVQHENCLKILKESSAKQNAGKTPSQAENKP